MSKLNWALLLTTDQTLAEIYKSILESNDIPVFLRSDMTQSVYPSLSDVEILVPASQLALATELINNVEIIYETDDSDQDDEKNQDY